MTRRYPLCLFLLALAAASLTGCGRRGPTELPAETQAFEAAMKAKQAEEQKALAAKGKTAKPKNYDASTEPRGVPGTTGNRPPEQFPFPLDPLL